MDNAQKILVVACAVEFGTGIALLVVPSLVVALLLGAEPDGIALIVSRVAGIALISLAIACWPNGSAAGGNTPYIGMLTYNTLTTLVLAQFGLAGGASGVLLWPVTLLHLTLSILLAYSWSRKREFQRVSG